MGYNTAANRWANTLPIDLVGGGLPDTRSAAPAATPNTTAAAGTTNGPAIELGDRSTLRLALIVSAITATSIAITIQTSADGGVTDAWRTADTIAAQTAAGTVKKSVVGCDRFVRAQFVQVGAGAATFTLAGEAPL